MFKNQKRIEKEKNDNLTPHEQFYIQPLPENMFNWHFTLRGVKGTEFEGGLYHGYMELPNDYPLSPPNIYFFTENGRFQVNTKICLTITSYHKEEWTPAWTINSMMQAVSAYFVVNDGGIGSINVGTQKRKELAIKSRTYTCPKCGVMEQIEKKMWGDK